MERQGLRPRKQRERLQRGKQPQLDVEGSRDREGRLPGPEWFPQTRQLCRHLPSFWGVSAWDLGLCRAEVPGTSPLSDELPADEPSHVLPVACAACRTSCWAPEPSSRTPAQWSLEALPGVPGLSPRLSCADWALYPLTALSLP